MLITTVCSTKGGVGKTTTTANLAGILADNGYRVLMVDGDIQPTLSSYFPLLERAPAGLHQLVTTGNPEGCISRVVIPDTTIQLDLVLSDDPDGSLENWILHTPDGRVRMKHALAQLHDRYDFILIDTQGATGPLQDVGVLAADLLLSPIPPEILSAREFSRGTLGMLERLRPMQHLGAAVGHLHGLIYRMDRTNDASQVAEVLRKSTFAESRGGISILETVIPSIVAFREAASQQVPVHRISAPAREVMEQLVTELFPHVELGQGCEMELLQSLLQAFYKHCYSIHRDGNYLTLSAKGQAVSIHVEMGEGVYSIYDNVGDDEIYLDLTDPLNVLPFIICQLRLDPELPDYRDFCQQQAARYRILADAERSVLYSQLRDGYLTFWEHEHVGWIKKLIEPERWAPGAVFIELATGHIFQAVGGTTQEGATDYKQVWFNAETIKLTRPAPCQEVQS